MTSVTNWLNAKRNHPDMLLLYRMGDFYESYHDDAHRTAKVLGLIHTTRTIDGKKIPMCGFPHHYLETHLHKLLRDGIRVAICEQVAAVPDGKEVERVESPAPSSRARFTLSDLADRAKLAEWLGYDGVRPTVSGYGYGERKPVVNAVTADAWWDEYRQSRRNDWARSKENPHKSRTWTQFVGECLSSIGIKGGTVADRIQRAKQERPDIFPPAVLSLYDLCD